MMQPLCPSFHEFMPGIKRGDVEELYALALLAMSF